MLPWLWCSQGLHHSSIWRAILCLDGNCCLLRNACPGTLKWQASCCSYQHDWWAKAVLDTWVTREGEALPEAAGLCRGGGLQNIDHAWADSSGAREKVKGNWGWGWEVPPWEPLCSGSEQWQRHFALGITAPCYACACLLPYHFNAWCAARLSQGWFKISAVGHG